MVMERQKAAPMALPQLVEEKSPEEKNLPLGQFVRGSSHAKRICREVAVTGGVSASGRCRAVYYDPLGLNESHSILVERGRFP